MVVPPDMTVLAYKSLRMSTSHFMMSCRWSHGHRRIPFPRRMVGRGLLGHGNVVANGDNLAIGQFIGFLQGGRGSSSCHFLFEVKGNIAKLFLDVTDNFTLSGGGERVASLGEDFHEVVGELTSS